MINRCLLLKRGGEDVSVVKVLSLQ